MIILLTRCLEKILEFIEFTRNYGIFWSSRRNLYLKRRSISNSSFLQAPWTRKSYWWPCIKHSLQCISFCRCLLNVIKRLKTRCFQKKHEPINSFVLCNNFRFQKKLGEQPNLVKIGLKVQLAKVKFSNSQLLSLLLVHWRFFVERIGCI